ncbi:MAG: tetratricopeptide repeat protein [Polyangiaceae bacterium]
MRDPRPALRQIREDLWRGRLDAAFALGESLLDEEPNADCYGKLVALLPRHVPEESRGHLLDLLRRVEQDASESHRPWRLYLRFVLLTRLALREEAFAASAELVELPPRYGWMRFERASLLLTQLWAYGEAIREYEAVLEATPPFWKASACLAEVELCLGKEREAFSRFDATIEKIPSGEAYERGAAIVWRAELRLWMGRYAEVLADLEAPCGRRDPYALGWRGAARLLTGDTAGALESLEQALFLNPSDGEAVQWRGEALAASGEWQAALADFDRAGQMRGPPLWALLGRALVMARLGDTAGFFDACEKLSRFEVGFYRAMPSASGEKNMEPTAAWLDDVRRRARGLRRPEGWLRRLWMAPRDWRETASYVAGGPAPVPHDDEIPIDVVAGASRDPRARNGRQAPRRGRPGSFDRADRARRYDGLRHHAVRA